MLNAYFGRIIPLHGARGGEVHQIVGDELMVVFGKDAAVPTTPTAQHGRRSCSSASRTASPTARAGLAAVPASA